MSGRLHAGHLAALAGLTANEPAFQPDMLDSDTSVDTVVSIYGRYDWEDRAREARARFMAFLERVVVRRRAVSRTAVAYAELPGAHTASI